MKNKRLLLLIISIVITVILTVNLVYGKANLTTSTQKTEDALKVIIYNTHTQEKFKYGDTIMDVSNTFSEKINSAGLPCKFLNNTNTDYINSYSFARKLILDNVQDYSKNILLDIHTTHGGIEESTTDIAIHIGKGHKDYERNEDFAIKLLKQINKLDKNFSTEISENEYRYSQDLSNKAIIIILGNESMSKEKVYMVLDVLAGALKNISE